MADPEGENRAIEALQGVELMGRPLRINKAGKIAATAAEKASIPVVPVVAAAAGAEIIPALKADPGGLEPPGFQFLGSRDQHFGSGVPPAGLLGYGVTPLACSAHPLHKVHQVSGNGPQETSPGAPPLGMGHQAPDNGCGVGFLAGLAEHGLVYRLPTQRMAVDGATHHDPVHEPVYVCGAIVGLGAWGTC